MPARGEIGFEGLPELCGFDFRGHAAMLLGVKLGAIQNASGGSTKPNLVQCIHLLPSGRLTGRLVWHRFTFLLTLIVCEKFASTAAPTAAGPWRHKR